jgi:hypothetical protein
VPTTTTVLPASRMRRTSSRRPTSRGAGRLRLVEHVERGRECAAEGGRELDALRLAARERAHLTIEREVVEPDAQRGVDTRTQAVEHALAARALRIGQLQRREPRAQLADREAPGVADAAPADLDRERLGAQPRAAAGLAGVEAPVARDRDTSLNL